MREDVPSARGRKADAGQGLRGRQPGQVRWKQIEEELATELIGGLYAPGSRLPTEPELMSRFGVGRHTVRQTMAGLEARGLVRIEQGRGTFVHDEVVHYRISERTRFTQNLLDQGREPAYRITGVAEAPGPAEICRHLELAEGEFLVRIAVGSFSDQVVIATSDVYFPSARFPNVGEVYRKAGSTTATYRRFGIDDYLRRRTRISARLPTEEEARRLLQPASRPILVSRKVDSDLLGRPLSYSETCWCADRVEFVVENENCLAEP